MFQRFRSLIDDVVEVTKETGTSVGSTFDDVRRALARTLDASSSLDGGAGHQFAVGSKTDVLGGTAAAFPGEDDSQLLRDLQSRRASGENRKRPSPTVETAPAQSSPSSPPPQQQQQRVEVRRVRRQTSESPATTPDGPDAVPTSSSSTSVGRLNAVEQFRRNEAKRVSVISHTSSLISSDGTINVVTDSEDEDDQKAAAATTHARQLPSPSSRHSATPVSPTRNGVLQSPTEDHRVAAHNGRESSLSPQRDVISASGTSPQPNSSSASGGSAVDVDAVDSATASPKLHQQHNGQSASTSTGSMPVDASTISNNDQRSGGEEEVEDIGKMFAVYGGKGGSLPHSVKPGNRSNLNRLSPFSSSKESITSVYSDAGDTNYSKYSVTGDIEFGLAYNYKQSTLEVHVKRCRGIAAVDTKRNCSDPYVKLYLLPDKTKNGKRKTRVKKHTLHPIFDEVLKYHVTKSELESRTLSVMVWNSDRLGRNDFLGEVNVTFDHHSFDDPTPKFYKLQDRPPLPVDEDGNVQSPLSMLTYKGDLNVCLKYVTSEQLNARRQVTSTSASSTDIRGGELLVLVKQARNLTAVRSNGFSDPFCKCCLLPDRSRSATHRSPVIRRNCNPAWNHTFVFEGVTWLELKDRSVELTIWDFDRLVSNDFLGGVRLNLGTGKSGHESVDWMDSKGEEISLWQAMLDRPNCWIEGTLLLRPHIAHRK